MPMNGISVDLNESYGNEGWWNTLTQAKEEYLMTPEDANKIIAFLKAGYGVVASEEFRRLANELRKASGQPEE
jgi:hypothetical protein